MTDFKEKVGRSYVLWGGFLIYPFILGSPFHGDPTYILDQGVHLLPGEVLTVG